jgi:hypothetical protein
VIALDPPTLDGRAALRGEVQYMPRREHLALSWKNKREKEVLHALYHTGCLLRACRRDATWLPKGWEMDVFPAGWTRPHLESWFEYALDIARIEDRPDISPGSDKSPAYAPTPRALVSHAFLIVRRLRLPNSPIEPRGLMDRAGCQAELRDVLDFFRGALESRNQGRAGQCEGSDESDKPDKPIPAGETSSADADRGRKARTKRGGKRPLGKSAPLKFQVYRRIQQEHRPGTRYRDTVDRLKADKQFAEQVSNAGLKLDTRLVRKALAFFDTKRQRDQARNKQQTD